MNAHLDALAAGISSIPVGTDKRPRVKTWGPYQERLPEHLECIEWDSWGCGIAVVCGPISDRLVAIDIEARFMNRLPELASRLEAAGLLELWTAWMSGYCEETPSGGLHVLVHVGGDGPVPHNDKLAVGSDGLVLIETRGDGGYCIIAPSRNGDRGWRLISGGLPEIAWCTPEEWAAVVAVLRSFDETPPPPPTPAVPGPSILRLSDSWIDDVLATLPPMEQVLDSLGYAYHHSDEHGSLWTRPGKPLREGYSCRINHSGRLMMFSSSTPIPPSERETYDQASVILAYELGRLPTLAERTRFLRAHRPVPSTAGGADQAAEAEPAPSSVRLDDAFWQSRDWLIAVRAAAWARGLAPSGVLGALLSAYATTIPMGIWVPAVWGERAPLNTYCCLVGRSGSGKTASMRLAADLLGPVHNHDILLGRSLRSGEGLPKLAMKPAPKRKRGEEQFPEEPTFRNAVQIHFDEGGALGKQAERSGATVIPYLNTAWAGHGIVGGTKSDGDFYFPADLVRICCVMGVQLGAAVNLFSGESAKLGFPQRLLFFGLRDEAMSDMDVDQMSLEPVRPLGLPVYHPADFTRQAHYLDVPADVVREVRTWTRDKEHGSIEIDGLDGHMMQLRLRVAAICALASGRMAVDLTDWDLATNICQTSRAIRAQLVAAIGDLSLDRARALGHQDVIREEIREDAWLSKRAKRIAMYIHRFDDGCSMSDIRTRLDSGEKKRREEIMAYAVAKGWVIHKDDRYFGGGERGGEN